VRNRRLTSGPEFVAQLCDKSTEISWPAFFLQTFPPRASPIGFLFLVDTRGRQLRNNGCRGARFRAEQDGRERLWRARFFALHARSGRNTQRLKSIGSTWEYPSRRNETASDTDINRSITRYLLSRSENTLSGRKFHFIEGNHVDVVNAFFQLGTLCRNP